MLLYLSLNQRLEPRSVLTHPQNRRGQHAPVLNPSQKRGGQHSPICNQLNYRHLRSAPCCPPPGTMVTRAGSRLIVVNGRKMGVKVGVKKNRGVVGRDSVGQMALRHLWPPAGGRPTHCRNAFYCVSSQTTLLAFEHFWDIFGIRFRLAEESKNENQA